MADLMHLTNLELTFMALDAIKELERRGNKLPQAMQELKTFSSKIATLRQTVDSLRARLEKKEIEDDLLST